MTNVSPHLLPVLRTLSPALLMALILTPQVARAQANLTFSGGSGTPLTLTLTAPISYTITASNATTGPYFIFKGTGDPFSSSFPSFTGSLTYSINGGAPQTITGLNSGQSFGALASNDIYVFRVPYPNVSPGDTILLSAGAITTTGNIAAARPADGAYTTLLAGTGFITQISTSGVAVSSAPEPGTLAFLALGGTLVLAKRHRRQA